MAGPTEMDSNSMIPVSSLYTNLSEIQNSHDKYDL